MLEPKTLQIDIPRGASLLDNILDDLLGSLLDSRTCLACEEKFRRYLLWPLVANSTQDLCFRDHVFGDPLFVALACQL